MIVTGVESCSFKLASKTLSYLFGNFSVNPASCQNSKFYQDYLKYSSLSDQENGRGVTHLFIDEDHDKLMGFVTLRASSFIYKDDDGNNIGNPAIEITVLAVDQNYERRYVGTNLIDYVVVQANRMKEAYAGVKYIVLSADELSVEFYEKMGFSSLNENWESIPRELSSVNCKPMAIML